MHEGLQTTKRTLLVLSPSYLTAVYPQQEWAATFVQDPQGKEGRLVPVRVRDCRPDGLLASLGYIDLVGIDDEVTARKQLLEGVRPQGRPVHMQPFPGAISIDHPPSFPGIWPLVWNVPYRRNPFFTGREVLLATLHERLSASTRAALTQAQAIQGLGGIGKTQTAVEYAYRHRKEYQAVLWVRGTASDTLISDFVTIAGLLRLPEKAAFPEVELETWPRCKLYLPHALVSADLVEQYGLAFPEASNLLHRAGSYLQEHAQYGPAEVILQQALSLRERLLGAEHPDTSVTLDRLAGLYRTQGQYEQAEPLYQRALSIREQTLGPEHPQTSVTLNNLAVLYRNQGQYSKAEPLYQRALAISEQTLGPEHPETAATLNNLAGLYLYLEQYEQAETLYQGALAIDERAYGQDHSEVAIDLESYAALLRQMDRENEAIVLETRARIIRSNQRS